MNPKLRSTITVAVSAFLTGALTYLSAHPIPETGEVDWRTVLGAAGLAGLAALVHLFMSPPTEAGQAAAAVVRAAKEQSGFVRLESLVLIAIVFTIGAAACSFFDKHPPTVCITADKIADAGHE